MQNFGTLRDEGRREKDRLIIPRIVAYLRCSAGHTHFAGTNLTNSTIGSQKHKNFFHVCMSGYPCEHVHAPIWQILVVWLKICSLQIMSFQSQKCILLLETGRAVVHPHLALAHFIFSWPLTQMHLSIRNRPGLRNWHFDLNSLLSHSAIT